MRERMWLSLQQHQTSVQSVGQFKPIQVSLKRIGWITIKANGKLDSHHADYNYLITSILTLCIVYDKYLF